MSVDRFGERACMVGGLGPRIPATELMSLAVAHALRLLSLEHDWQAMVVVFGCHHIEIRANL
jgi:hypothetical protein